MIAGVSSAALDMHTLQGKKAIKAFHTSMVKKGSKAMAALGEKSEDVVKGAGLDHLHCRRRPARPAVGVAGCCGC